MPSECRGLKDRGGQDGKVAGSNLIVSLCKAQQPDEALQVYNNMLNYIVPSEVSARRLSTPPRWLEPYASSTPQPNSISQPDARSHQETDDSTVPQHNVLSNSNNGTADKGVGPPAASTGCSAMESKQYSSTASSTPASGLPSPRPQYLEPEDPHQELLANSLLHPSQLPASLPHADLCGEAPSHAAAHPPSLCQTDGAVDDRGIQDLPEADHGLPPAAGASLSQQSPVLPASPVSITATAPDLSQDPMEVPLMRPPARSPARNDPHQELHKAPARSPASVHASAAGSAQSKTPPRSTNPFWHHQSRSHPVAIENRTGPSWPASEGTQEESLHSSQSGQGRQALAEAGPLIPQSAAIAALVSALACRGRLEEALQVFRQLQQDTVGLASTTLGTGRTMWQSLIEVACRRWRIDTALEVNSGPLQYSTGFMAQQ